MRERGMRALGAAYGQWSIMGGRKEGLFFPFLLSSLPFPPPSPFTDRGGRRIALFP